MKLITYAVLILLPVLALANAVPVPVPAPGEIIVPGGDPLQTLLNLILNIKTMSPIAIASAVIVIAVQIADKFFASSNLKKAAVAILSVAYAVVQALISGLGVVEALALVLLTMGGATMIYNFVVKPFLKK